jgi:hypothetical protein
MSESVNQAAVYCSVKFTVGWLPGSLGFTEAAKSALAASLKVDRRIIRGNYSILGSSRDPLIQEGAALKRLLTTIRDTYTIPEYTLVSSATNKDEMKSAKVAGSYLIEAVKVEEFLTRFNEVRDQYLAWGKRVSEPQNYERIRDADKTALGSDWDVISTRYPTAEHLADAVTCDVPRIEPFNASFTLADVAPATAKRLAAQAEARLMASVEGATAELVVEFKNMIEGVARSCGRRVRLLPPVGHVRQDLRYAEVQQILRHIDEENVPEGSLLVTVQPCRPKDNDSDTYIRVGKEEDILVTEADYKAMCPFETDENKVLTQSSFENLLGLASKISSVKSMLGGSSESKDLTSLAEEVSAKLGSMGGSAAEITKQLRTSGYARQQAKATFNDFLTKITTQEIEVRARAKTRRKIKVGGGIGE